MTKLLVSVRDVAEAQLALDAGVDLIDIKEPRHGSLGKADDAVIRGIAAVVGRQRPLSIALGELADYHGDQFSQLHLPAEICFAKIGLAGCQRNPAWPRQLATLWEQLPGAVGRIAVVYADWQTAAAPSPEEVLNHAAKLKCRGVLIDTFDKSLPGLATLWSSEQIQKVTSAARQSGILSVLAGRISAADLPNLLPHRPDFAAVRGAVCNSDRNGTIDAAKICSLRKLIAANLEFRCRASQRVASERG